MTVFLMSLGFAGGFSVCWFGKDKLVLWYKGADAFAKALEAKVAAIKTAR